MHWHVKKSTAYFMKRRKILLSLVSVLFLFNIIFHFLWVRPAGMDRDNKQRLYGEMRRAIAGRNTLQQRYYLAKKDMQLFNSSLLKREEEVKLVQEITSFTGDTKLTLKNARYSRKHLKEAGLWLYAMELPFTGQYEAIMNLLAKIRSSPYILCVERFKINRVKDGPLEILLTTVSYLR